MGYRPSSLPRITNKSSILPRYLLPVGPLARKMLQSKRRVRVPQLAGAAWGRGVSTLISLSTSPLSLAKQSLPNNCTKSKIPFETKHARQHQVLRPISTSTLAKVAGAGCQYNTLSQAHCGVQVQVRAEISETPCDSLNLSSSFNFSLPSTLSM